MRKKYGPLGSRFPSRVMVSSPVELICLTGNAPEVPYGLHAVYPPVFPAQIQRPDCEPLFLNLIYNECRHIASLFCIGSVSPNDAQVRGNGEVYLSEESAFGI